MRRLVVGMRRWIVACTAGLIAFLALFAPATSASAGAGSFQLNPGETLTPGQQLVSQTGGYAAVMQSDGNFVEYAPGGTAVWATKTNGHPGSVIQMQGDGNLVVYAPGHVAIWATGTGGKTNADLELQGDSNLVIYAPGHVAVWARETTSTSASTPTAPADPVYPTAPRSFVSAPAPFPAPGVIETTGPNICGGFTTQNVEGQFYNPRISNDGTRVEDVVGVQTSNAACNNGVTAYLETKVCGGWGCNWQVKDKRNYSQLPVNGLLVSDVLSTPLRAGTNSYRLRLEITTYEFDAEADDVLGFFGYVPNVEESYSNTIKLTG